MYWAWAEPTAKTPNARPATEARMGVTPVCILLSFNTLVNQVTLQTLTMRLVLSSHSSVAFQILLKQVQNALVLVRPTDRLNKAMILNRINGKIPVFLAQLNQPLHQPDSILEMDVGIHHAMADQQRPFQPLSEIDR